MLELRVFIYLIIVWFFKPVFNKMSGFVSCIYLQVSFGNASFLYAELKVLHLPAQQKIIKLWELLLLF